MSKTNSHSQVNSNYEVTLHIKFSNNPKDLISNINELLKDINVEGMSYHLIENRPTNDEHHGGMVN